MTAVLFQEDLAGEPFWLLVCCILANRTRGDAARRALAEIRRVFPEPASLCNVQDLGFEHAHAYLSRLGAILKPLGLVRNRTRSILALANEFDPGKVYTWREITELPGCGKYAADSYAIFVLGRRRGIRPTDYALKDYMKRTAGG